jgi:Nucleotidyl transferase AbiEii toxin, Type IV TA system
MASSPLPSRLTLLQRDLLAGFYFGHRQTDDLDLFSAPGPSLDDAARAVGGAAIGCGASAESVRTFPEFRRLSVSRGDETCIVDLVIDHAEMIEPTKADFGDIRVDTLRDIAANKVCTLIGRSEIKDLVDFERLIAAGIDIETAFVDAQRKDGGADPASVAWVIDQITIGPNAALPGGVEPARVVAFRDSLVKKLRAMAMNQVRRS